MFQGKRNGKQNVWKIGIDSGHDYISHWRGPWRPLSVQFLSFSCSFWEKNWRNNSFSCRPFEFPPPREIPNLPLFHYSRIVLQEDLLPAEILGRNLRVHSHFRFTRRKLFARTMRQIMGCTALSRHIHTCYLLFCID